MKVLIIILIFVAKFIPSVINFTGIRRVLVYLEQCTYSTLLHVCMYVCMYVCIPVNLYTSSHIFTRSYMHLSLLSSRSHFRREAIDAAAVR